MNNNDIILKKKLSFSHGYLTKEKYIEIDKNGNITVKKRDYSNEKHSEYKNVYSTNDNIPISSTLIKVLDTLLVSPTIITDGRTLPIKDPFDEILKMIKYIKENPDQTLSNPNNSNNNNTNIIDNYNKIKEEHLNLESKLSDFEINYDNLKEEHNKLNHAYNSLALMNNNLNYEYNKIKQELVNNTNSSDEEHELNNNTNSSDEEINLLKEEINMYKTKEIVSLNEILELKNVNHKLNEYNVNLKEAINNNNEKAQLHNNEKEATYDNEKEAIYNNEKEELNLLKVDIEMYKMKEKLSLSEILGLKNVNHKVNEENFNLKEAITNLNQNITIINKSNEDTLLRKRIKELEENNKSLENVNKLNVELTNRISHLLDEINEKNLDNKKLLMNYTNLNDQYQKLLDKHLKVSELKNISKYFKN
jgi:hypothetical protein